MYSTKTRSQGKFGGLRPIAIAGVALVLAACGAATNASPQLSGSASGTPSATSTDTGAPTSTDTASASASASTSGSASASGSASGTASASDSATPTGTGTGHPTATPTGTHTTSSPTPTPTASQPLRELRILETSPGFFDIPLYAMIHDGYALKHHLTLNINTSFGGSGSSSQIFAGCDSCGDVLMGGITAPVGLQQSGALNVTIFGTLMQKGVFMLVSKRSSGLTTLHSLIGKKVGISGALSFNDSALRDALVTAGVTPSQVKITALGASAAQYAALLSGSADAVQLQSPILDVALAAGCGGSGCNIIYDFRQKLEPALVFTARTARIASDPLPYRNFILAYQEVLTRMYNDNTYALSVANRAYGSITPAGAMGPELLTYLRNPGIECLDGLFTQTLYNNGRLLMLNSGQYSSVNFPSFATLTSAFHM